MPHITSPDAEVALDVEWPVLDKGFVALVDYMGGDPAVARAARVSHLKKGKSSDKNLIRYMMTNRHTSPFEHVILTFHVKAPLFVFRQWHRHRTQSYNELSARYSEMPDEFYVPKLDTIMAQDTKNKQGRDGLLSWPRRRVTQILVEKASKVAYHFYSMLIELGVSRELARIVLPVNLYSEMYTTVNLHNLLHFLSLRADEHAQFEIRVYAERMLELARFVAPVSVEAWEKMMDFARTDKVRLSEVQDAMRDIRQSLELEEIDIESLYAVTCRFLEEEKGKAV